MGGELARALSRPDADEMCKQLKAYAEHIKNDTGDGWPEKDADDFYEIITCHFDDPEKAFAYVILGASQSDDARFLGLLGCSLLEDLLDNPSDELLDRVDAEARKSDRFCWLLSNPFKVAVSPKAWEVIKKYRLTGPHEEPSTDSLPPRT